jgi:DNA-binding FrmR family transcriptional regulator
MSHTVHEKKKPFARVRSIRGQVEAIECALDDEAGCEQVMHLIAGVRGAIAGLMAEVSQFKHICRSPNFVHSVRRSTIRIKPYTQGSYLNAGKVALKPNNWINAAMAGIGDGHNGGGPIWAVFDTDAVTRENWVQCRPMSTSPAASSSAPTP